MEWNGKEWSQENGIEWNVFKQEKRIECNGLELSNIDWMFLSKWI